MPPDERALAQQAVISLIARVAGQANVLTIPRLFIDWTGDHLAALLLSQMLYWSERTKDPDGWFYKSAKEWEAELGISGYKLTRATKQLGEAGVETTLRKVNGAPTLHYRIDQNRFWDWIFEKLENPFRETPAVDFRGTGKSISENVKNPFPRNSAMDFRETGETLTETTTETTRQRSFEDSRIRKVDRLADKYDETRIELLPFVQDFARELGDEAPLAATMSRVVNIYRRSGLDLDAFAGALYRAKAITQERTASIKKPAAGGGLGGRKPKMAYFLAVLEDLASPDEQAG